VVDSLVVAPLGRSERLELVERVDNSLEQRLSKDGVMSNELVNVRSQLSGVLLLLKSFVVTFGGEDGDDLGNDVRAGGELVESGLV
jgi:hypothetical protein